jgi:hypothetical protein
MARFLRLFRNPNNTVLYMVVAVGRTVDVWRLEAGAVTAHCMATYNLYSHPPGVAEKLATSTAQHMAMASRGVPMAPADAPDPRD